MSESETKMQDSIAIAEAFVRSENRLKEFKERMRDVVTPSAELIAFVEENFRSAQARLDRDLLARQLLDQARIVVAARYAREQAIDKSPLGEFEQDISVLLAEHKAQNDSEEQAPMDLDPEELKARFRTALESGDQLGMLRYLQQILILAKVHFGRTKLPARVKYKFDSPPPAGTVN